MEINDLSIIDWIFGFFVLLMLCAMAFGFAKIGIRKAMPDKKGFICIWLELVLSSTKGISRGYLLCTSNTAKRQKGGCK